MENTSTPSNICNFDSIECNGIIRLITHNTKIPKSTESIISVGMYLCQIHYNRFILNKLEILIIIRIVNIQNMMNIKINQKIQKKNQKNLLLKKFQKD